MSILHRLTVVFCLFVFPPALVLKCFRYFTLFNVLFSQTAVKTGCFKGRYKFFVIQFVVQKETFFSSVEHHIMHSSIKCDFSYILIRITAKVIPIYMS